MLQNVLLQQLLPTQSTEHLNALCKLQLPRQTSTPPFGTRLGTHNPPSLPQSPFPNEGMSSLLSMGGLLQLSSLWVTYIPDLWVQSVVSKGYKIEFTNHKFHLSNQPKSGQGQSDLQISLNHVLSQGVVAPVPLEDRFKGSYSNMFTATKPIGYLQVPKFCMESTRLIIASPR